MDQYGLTGSKLSHSFSASWFSEKFKREGIDAAYSNYELHSVNQLRNLVNDVSNLKGLNVTIPFKIDVIPLLNELHSSATESGAVNTIKIYRSSSEIIMKGFNTDSLAFEQTLKPLLKPHHRSAMILGTGGAAMAVKAALNRLHIDSLMISRSADEKQIAYKDITDKWMLQHQLIVNCTPVGMFPDMNVMPLVPMQYMTSSHLVYDLIYNPGETLLLKRAAEKGATVKNGLDMLHLQAELSWEIWSNDAL